MTQTLKFMRTENNLGYDGPFYATQGAAGMDIIANETVTFAPGEWKAVGTGLAVAIPEGYELQVRPRSGLAYGYGLTVLNSPGTIDSDYRGEIKIILINHAPDVNHILAGERIAQLVLAKVERLPIEMVTELDQTERGEGGFGSTGR